MRNKALVRLHKNALEAEKLRGRFEDWVACVLSLQFALRRFVASHCYELEDKKDNGSEN